MKPPSENAVHQLDWYLHELHRPDLPDALRGEYYSAAQQLLHRLDAAVRTWQRVRPVYEGRLEKAMGHEPVGSTG